MELQKKNSHILHPANDWCGAQLLLPDYSSLGLHRRPLRGHPFDWKEALNIGRSAHGLCDTWGLTCAILLILVASHLNGLLSFGKLREDHRVFLLGGRPISLLYAPSPKLCRDRNSLASSAIALTLESSARVSRSEAQMYNKMSKANMRGYA